MTRDEFLEQLRKSRRGWELGPLGQVRQFGWGLVADPISASVDPPVLWNMCHMPDLANRMGLDYETQLAIVRASDNSPQADPDLRQQILDACGLLMPAPHPTVQ